MKFFINRDSIQYAIQNVQRAVSSRSPLPILSGILFQCEEDRLRLSATDMEMFINCSVPATVTEPGSIVIPSRYITDFCRKLPDQPIHFETIGNGDILAIKYGQSEFSINGFSAAEFPSFQAMEGEFSFSASSEKLKNFFKQVIYACSGDESRPVFTGVLMEIKGSNVILVATDIFRMAIKNFTIESLASEAINIIVPGKTLHEAVRLLGASETVTVTVSRKHITFETEDSVINSRLITGNFPSYRQVIPESFNCNITIGKNEMLDSADRASLLAGERNSLVMFQSREDSAIISARSENGWIREEIPASVEGENMDILFNVKYLGDALRACEGDKISIMLTGSSTPAILKSLADEDYMAIIVPARYARE